MISKAVVSRPGSVCHTILSKNKFSEFRQEKPARSLIAVAGYAPLQVRKLDAINERRMMMKTLTTLFALSTLALTACSESGTGQNSDQSAPQEQVTEENPFETVEPGTEMPSEDSPISNSPVVETEVEQSPVIESPSEEPPVVLPPTPETDPLTGSLNSNQFLNGSSVDSASSFWVCLDSDSADDVAVLAFFADGSGFVGDEETLLPTSWSTSGPYLELYTEGQYLGQLDNVSVSLSAGTLNTSYVLSDGETGVLDCQLAELDDSAGVDGTAN